MPLSSLLAVRNAAVGVAVGLTTVDWRQLPTTASAGALSPSHRSSTHSLLAGYRYAYGNSPRAPALPDRLLLNDVLQSSATFEPSP